VKAWSGDGFEPVKFNILVAMNLSQLGEFLIRWCNVKYLNVQTNFMKDLWSDKYVSWQWPIWINSASMHCCIRTLFLLSLFWVYLQDRNVMAYSQQLVLTLTFISSVFGVSTFLSTFDSEFGLSWVTMRQTLLDQAVLHFVFMLAMLFMTAMMGWMMLDREDVFPEALQIGWRALVLSEGEQIDDISAVRDMGMFGYLARGAALLCVFFFATFLTNLFVAIFSNAYSKARQKVSVLFLQNRLFVARNCIVARPAKIPHWLQQLICQKCSVVTGIVGVLVAVAMQVPVHFCFQTYPKIGCVLSTLSIFVFTSMVGLLKTIPFEYVNGVNHWFSTESSKEHVMIVWCRRDFQERYGF